MITEAEKSHDLLSAHWRPRRASVVIQSESDSLSARAADQVSLSLRTEKTVSQLKQGGRKGTNSPFLCLLFTQALSGLHDAHSHWGGQSSYLGPHSRANLSKTPRNNV